MTPLTSSLLLYKCHPQFITNRCLSTGTESINPEFAGPNAYQLLGVSETSSFAEIKDSFRKLAKETHPDLAHSTSTSKRFVEILAAYEVRHMHWYQLGDEVSTCECRCSRAKLPPSKFWLFEPRCGMHNIGGWYVETFVRDKKGRNVPSQRYWDGLEDSNHFEKRLHPAMYLLALAYRTLDIECSRRNKQRMKDLMESNVSRIVSWCKRLVR